MKFKILKNYTNMYNTNTDSFGIDLMQHNAIIKIPTPSLWMPLIEIILKYAREKKGKMFSSWISKAIPQLFFQPITEDIGGNLCFLQKLI